jgi:regulator of sigma E protease
MLDTLHTIISFLTVITIIVFVHEFGHYYVARLFGVRVEVFSIGFGRVMWSRKDRNNTAWQVCAIPIGGYVRMFGDANEVSAPEQSLLAGMNDAEKRAAFHTQSLLTKSAIVVAGPVANFLLAIIIMSSMFYFYGKPYAPPVVGFIKEGSPAERSGIEIGDRITAIDKMSIESFSDIENAMALNLNESVEVELEREGVLRNILIKPELMEHKTPLGEEIKHRKIGIGVTTLEYKKCSLIEAISSSATETYKLSYITLKSLGQMVLGQRGTESLGGPIKIAQYSGKSAKQGGLVFLWFIAVLSINLGLFNLLPIPALDGGHLLYYALYAVLGAKIADNFHKHAIKIGIALLVGLMIFTTFKDIHNILFE